MKKKVFLFIILANLILSGFSQKNSLQTFGDCVIDLMLKGRLNIREAEGYSSTCHRIYETKQNSLVQNPTINH